MDHGAAKLRRVMLLLGDPSRFALVRSIAAGERCVTELAAGIGLSQSCTTRHLQALRTERIVRSRRDGKRVLYSLRDDDALVAEVVSLALGRAMIEGASSVSAFVSDLRGGQDQASEPVAGEPVPAAEDDDADGRAPRSRSEIEDYLL